MLKQRVISAVVGLVVLVPILFSPQAVVDIAVAACTLFVLFELYRSMGFLANKPMAVLGLLLPVCIWLGTFVLHDAAAFWQIAVYCYVAAVFLILILCHKTVRLSDMAMMVALTALITLFLGQIGSVRALPYGRFFIWAVFIGAFLPDTFAYFVGRAFGKHKLAPAISPKKTVEGALGGLAGGVVFMLLYAIFIDFLFQEYTVNYLHFAILGLLAAIAAELGDLAMSAVKRSVGIKDFGRLMPGHGGLLDRLDSVLFVAPLVYLFASYIPLIGR